MNEDVLEEWSIWLATRYGSKFNIPPEMLELAVSAAEANQPPPWNEDE